MYNLCRVNQRFLLATSTKIDVSGVKVPDTINDKYFARFVEYLFSLSRMKIKTLNHNDLKTNFFP